MIIIIILCTTGERILIIIKTRHAGEWHYASLLSWASRERKSDIVEDKPGVWELIDWSSIR